MPSYEPVLDEDVQIVTFKYTEDACDILADLLTEFSHQDDPTNFRCLWDQFTHVLKSDELIECNEEPAVTNNGGFKKCLLAFTACEEGSVVEGSMLEFLFCWNHAPIVKSWVGARAFKVQRIEQDSSESDGDKSRCSEEGEVEEKEETEGEDGDQDLADYRSVVDELDDEPAVAGSAMDDRIMLVHRAASLRPSGATSVVREIFSIDDLVPLALTEPETASLTPTRGLADQTGPPRTPERATSADVKIPWSHRMTDHNRARCPTVENQQAMNEYISNAQSTFRGDRRYQMQPIQVVKSVLAILRNPPVYKIEYQGKDGDVYILRDPVNKLVKIGWTREDDPNERLKQIRGNCKAFFAGWHEVTQDAATKHSQFQLLERLVHEDLSPHRWFFRCTCGKDGKTVQHKEWFDVEDEVAVQTVYLWRKFLLREPYEKAGPGEQKRLKPKWEERLKNLRAPRETETHENHRARLQRWSKALQIKLPLDELPPTKEPVKTIDLSEWGRKAATTASMGAVDNKHSSGAANLGFDLPIRIKHDSRAQSPTPEPRRGAAQTQLGDPASDREQTIGERFTPDSSTDQSNPLKGAASRANPPVDVHISIDTDRILQSLRSFLTHQRTRVHHGSILDDLLVLRWPLALAFVLSFISPYAPPALASVTWAVFLPVFVAELRGWWPTV